MSTPPKRVAKPAVGFAGVVVLGLVPVVLGACNALPVIAGVHPSGWSAVVGGGAVLVVAAVNLWRIQRRAPGDT